MKASIKRTIDEYGFEKLDVWTSEGGHKSICFYGVGTVDIGFISSMNPHGMGVSDYIRNADDVQKHIANVAKTIWLDVREKAACVEFFLEIETKARAFLKVKERFDVKKSYQASKQGHNTFTFTEKEPVMTLHTKITIAIEQPSGGEGGWNEGNAWRALYDALDSTRERKDWTNSKQYK